MLRSMRAVLVSVSGGFTVALLVVHMFAKAGVPIAFAAGVATSIALARWYGKGL